MPRNNSQTTLNLLSATAASSSRVIAERVLAFSNPMTILSPWHQSEVHRMSREKITAASQGAFYGWVEMSQFPYRLWHIAISPTTWTPHGSIKAWDQIAELWLGVGNTVLKPAASAAARNQSRLTRRRSDG